MLRKLPTQLNTSSNGQCFTEYNLLQSYSLEIWKRNGIIVNGNTETTVLRGRDAPSMRSQCPVSTQMSTRRTEREKDRSSARVKRPQQPKEILQ